MTGVLIREEIKPHRRKCCETVQANVRVVQLQDEARRRLLGSAEAQKDPYQELLVGAQPY